MVRVQRPDGTETNPDEVGEIAVGGTPGITLFAPPALHPLPAAFSAQFDATYQTGLPAAS